MKTEQLKQRISDALEAELSKIYDEENIQSGDISPLDSLRWDELVDQASELFGRLIEWNRPERICWRCLAGLEHRKGPQSTIEVYFDEDDENDPFLCDWCDTNLEDTLYIIE